MCVLQKNLAILNVSGNHLESLEDLGMLGELQQVMATDNELNNMKVLLRALGCCRYMYH